MALCPNQSLLPCSIAAANKAVEDILSRGSDDLHVRKTPRLVLNSPRSSRTLHVARTSNLLLKRKQELEREPQNMI